MISDIAMAARPRLKLGPFRIDELLTDVRKYIESKPQQLDGEKLQIDNIGWMLIHNDEAKYLEKSVAKWELDLKAPENHFDAMQTVTTPLQKAGAYWVTAKMQDGNEARIVLWVADTAISRKRVEDGTMYYVADAVTGAPIDRADLEFFGWRQEYRQNRKYRDFHQSLCRSNGCGWPEHARAKGSDSAESVDRDRSHEGRTPGLRRLHGSLESGKTAAAGLQPAQGVFDYRSTCVSPGPCCEVSPVDSQASF